MNVCIKYKNQKWRWDELKLVYNIVCKTSTGTKPLRIRFGKIDGLIRVLDGENKH